MLSSCEAMVSMCCPNGGYILKDLRAGSWESWAAGPASSASTPPLNSPGLFSPLQSGKDSFSHSLHLTPHFPRASGVASWMLPGVQEGTEQEAREMPNEPCLASSPPYLSQEEPTSFSSIYWSWAEAASGEETYTVRKMGASRLWLGLQCSWTPTLSWRLEDFPAFGVAVISAKVGIDDLDPSSIFQCGYLCHIKSKVAALHCLRSEMKISTKDVFLSQPSTKRARNPWNWPVYKAPGTN